MMHQNENEINCAMLYASSHPLTCDLLTLSERHTAHTHVSIVYDEKYIFPIHSLMENSTKVSSFIEKKHKKKIFNFTIREMDVKEEKKLNKLLKSDMTAWWATGN